MFSIDFDAAHAIRMGDFQEWGIFYRRMQNDPDYEVNARKPCFNAALFWDRLWCMHSTGCTPWRFCVFGFLC